MNTADRTHIDKAWSRAIIPRQAHFLTHSAIYYFYKSETEIKIELV